MSFPKLSWVEVQNFQSIKHGRVEFDESNIINFKGYNDSGKTAFLYAIGVAMYDAHSTKQRGFIHHGEHFFTVYLGFEDGVVIRRDKYQNGNSLWEMYEGDTVLYSSKVGNKLTAVKGVPEEIVKYLGLVETSEGKYLNFQSVHDKRFLIQTSGKENLELLNGVLKLKETALASELVKKDLNEIQSEVASYQSELNACQLSLQQYSSLNPELISKVSALDKKEDEISSRLNLKQSAFNAVSRLGESSGVTVSEIPVVDTSFISGLERAFISLQKLSDCRSTNLELSTVSVGSLPLLVSLSGIVGELGSLRTTSSEIPKVSGEKLSSLTSLLYTVESYLSAREGVSSGESALEKLREQSRSILSKAREDGIQLTRCGACGELTIVEELQ